MNTELLKLTHLGLFILACCFTISKAHALECSAETNNGCSCTGKYSCTRDVVGGVDCLDEKDGDRIACRDKDFGKCTCYFVEAEGPDKDNLEFDEGASFSSRYPR